jgi:hypothetical protein
MCSRPCLNRFYAVLRYTVRRVKNRMTQQSAATTARMKSHLTTATASTIPSTTSAASKSKRITMLDNLPLLLGR